MQRADACAWCVVAVLLGSGVLDAQHWPSFRGRHASGIADGQHPPLSWDALASRNVVWKVPVPGLGHSSPVVWGDRVFVTSAVSSRPQSVFRRDVTSREGDLINIDSSGDRTRHVWRVYCLDKRTGKMLWEATAHDGVPVVDRHIRNSHATATPATNGEYVVVFFGSEGLYAFRMDGTLAWKRDLGVLDAGSIDDPDFQWGLASSPVLFRNLVIVQCDVQDGSFLAAFDLVTGREVWRTQRDEFSSWSTPTIYEHGSTTELVTNGTRFVRGYDPLTGTELWRLSSGSENAIPTPVATADLIFVASGYRPVQPIAAIRPGAKGDITPGEGSTSNTSVAWSTRRGGPYIPTPLVYGEHLYVLANNGVLTTYDARTGARVYQQRLAGRGGAFSASPVAADGRIYFASEDGDVHVVKAGAAYELLATNPVGEVMMATPAISQGLLLVRTLHHLYAFGDSASSASSPWVRIPAQTVQVGCVAHDRECSPNEQPRHPVRISSDFWLMATEVTVDAFRAHAAKSGTRFPLQPEWSAADHPVVNVTWDEAAQFCAAAGGRLPTEVEWEAAARGGRDNTIYPWGDRYERGLVNDSDEFKHSATTPVGTFGPNAYGLYDMIGNVWEWLQDWSSDDYYARSPANDPRGPETGTARITRGGSWRPYPRVFRISNRGRSRPDRASYYIGFRCARDVRSER
jgi:formylglycine-generating enzyme required for sulfatase activity